MWRGVWAGVPQDEVPIGTVTNGIHYRSWISAEMAELYDRYLGPRWSEDPTDQVVWKEVEQIPAEELWRTHERRRERLVAYARRRLRQQLERRGAPPAEIDAADEALDPAALTIGFARRFATYKRAALLLQDTRRLESLLNAPDRPVQILFAGKAHPKDNEGKQLIRDLVHASRSTELRRRIVFLEDYDMSVTRYLVQGCDIWLSTPRRLMEASGTSGMKAAANGALNMSVLDGWWDEAYRTGMGWAIGRGEIYDDFAYQDRVEANAIYDLLEKDAVPLFYQRGRDGLPRAWILRMKAAMRELCPVFNSNRMVHEYATSYYLPAADRSAHFAADGLAAARALAAWKANVLRAWPKVKIVKTEVDSPPQPAVGHLVKLRAAVQLGGLGPDDVAVELYAGPVDSRGDLDGGAPVAMAWTGDLPDGAREFAGEVRCTRSGQCGVTVRVRPTHADLSGPFELRLVTWAQ
jgi:starch phosphorylase